VKTKAQLNQVSTIVQLPRPADIDEALHPDFVDEPAYFPADWSAVHRFAWARGMTDMRAFQSDPSRSRVIARVILGGTFGPTIKVADDGTRKEQWYAGRMPGVLEEVLFSIRFGQPVFLIGAFGGVARLVIDLLQGKRHPAAAWAFQSKAPFATETRDLYAARGRRWWYYGDEPRLDGLPTDHPKPIVDFLAEAWKPRPGTKWETGINPLTRDQNLELFESVDQARIVELVLTGLTGL
jgi:hypothetical protein